MQNAPRENRLLPALLPHVAPLAELAAVQLTHWTERAWHNIDKASWPVGAWTNECDKRQWVDPLTGLDCMFKRNTDGGFLCGYVGVPEGHALFGKDYNDEVPELTDAMNERLRFPLDDRAGFGLMLQALTGNDGSPATIDSAFDVHGGITYASDCDEPTREQYDKRGNILADPVQLLNAKQYPEGDAAKAIADAERQAAMTFAAWLDDQSGRRICHVPFSGRPEKVWWFGFDCGHAWDMSPGYTALFARLGLPSRGMHADSQYRDEQYVRNECARLAAQLSQLSM